MAGTQSPDNVTQLELPVELTDRDKILSTLKTLVTEIEAGELNPDYFVYFLGEEMEETPGAVQYIWDAVGLSVHETIGHLMTYISRLTSE